MRLPNLKNKGVSGFTLVEMAIVLVIIGIILAGVMKGRDIVRGAQVKQFSQQFAQKWGTIAQTYYDKTGQQLNDGLLNGGNQANANGLMDGLTLSPVLSASMITTLQNVGIQPCALVKSKLVNPVANVNVTANSVVCVDGGGANVLNIWQTLVEGEYTGSVMVEVDLVNLILQIGGLPVTRNCVVLYGVPTDVAQGLDTAIDGRNDATSGNCVGVSAGYAVGVAPVQLNEGANVTAIMGVPVAWGAANASLIQDVAIVLDY